MKVYKADKRNLTKHPRLSRWRDRRQIPCSSVNVYKDAPAEFIEVKIVKGIVQCDLYRLNVSRGQAKLRLSL